MNDDTPRHAAPTDLSALLAHADWVRALARSLVRDEHAAEDVVQDAWVAALERPPREGSAWRAYLGTIVKNLVRDRRKVGANRERRERATARHEAQEPVDRFETFQELVRAVDALDEPYRSAVVLRWFEGLPPRAIAERLGVSVKTVSSRLERGLAKLRERLDREHGDRATWMALVLPIAREDGSPIAPVVGVQTKLVAAMLLVIAAGAWWWWSVSDGAWSSSTSSSALASEDVARETMGSTAIDASSSSSVKEAREPLSSSVARDPGWNVPHVGVRVLTSDEGPIAGARVSVWHSPLETADTMRLEFPDARSLEQEKRTDAEGWAVFAVQPGRGFTAEVDVEGRVPQRLDFLFADSEHWVRFGSPKTVRGRVTRASDGTPIEGARVACSLAGKNSPDSNDELVAEFVTGADGAYAIEGLASESVALYVSVPGWSFGFANVQLAGVDAPMQDFALAELERVRGVVRDARTQRPIANALVDLHPGSFRRVPVTTDADGRYEIPGFGDWNSMPMIRARAKGYGEVVAQRRNDAPVVDIELEAERVLRGRVVDERGVPVEGAFVTANGWHRGDGFGAVERRGTRTSGDGRFEIAGLRSANAHRVDVHLEGSGGLAIEAADESSPSAVVDVGDLVLRRAGSIAGMLRGGDGALVRGAKVAATRAGATTPARTSGTDASGRFALFELDAGEYDVSIEVAGRARVEPKRVVVVAERTSEIAIELPRGLAIRGRVVGPSGVVVGGASVLARTKQGAEIATCSSTAEGTFELVDLPPGAYELEAKLSRNVQTPAGIVRVGRAHAKDVGAGSDAVELALPPYTKSRGRVLDANGSPMRDAVVRLVDEDGSGMFMEPDAQGRFATSAAIGNTLHVAIERMEPDAAVPNARRVAETLHELDWIVSEEELVIRLPK